MAQTIKLKRSATAGNIPSTSNIALGEVAINTTDGKLFIKRSVGGTESIVEVGSTADGLTVLNGSVSAPTYSFSNDTDTGMFLSSVGYLGLTVAGSKQLEIGGGIIYTATTGKIRSASNNGSLELSGGGATVGGQILLSGGTSNSDITFKTGADSSTPPQRMKIASNGDISFYNDSAAQGLFWDSSASSLGLGTTNPSSYYAKNLVVSAASEGGLTIASTATSHTNYILFADGTSGDSAFRGQIAYNHNNDLMNVVSSGTMDFRTGSSRAIRLTINSSGNASFSGAVTSTGLNIDTTDPFMSFKESGATKLFIGESSVVGGGGAGFYDFYAVTGLGLRFFTNSTKKMTLTSGGDLLVGKSNVDVQLRE
jgi:hypothetical protein